MRDDVTLRIKELITLYRKKLTLINNIISTNRKCFSYLTSNEIHIVEETLEADNGHIEQVNLLDYHIAQLKTTICQVSGVEEASFEHYFSCQGSELTDELDLLARDLSALLSEALSGRERIIAELEERMHSVQKDIKEISMLRKTKKLLKELHKPG